MRRHVPPAGGEASAGPHPGHHQPTLRDNLTASAATGHVSLRFIKKMCFVFLEREAPLLAEPLLRDAVDGNATPNTAAAFRTSSALPVLEIIMELNQNVKSSAPPTGSSDATAAVPANRRGGGGAQEGISKVWDVPPRYERLRQAHHAQRAADTKQRDARRMWGNAHVDAVGVDGLVALEDTADEREHHHAADALIHVTAEELLRRPPYISAYRVVPLSDCPLSIQKRAHIDPQWLREVQRETSNFTRSESAPPGGGGQRAQQLSMSAVEAVLPTLFVCWCRLYGSSSGTLLFSDAFVLQRSNNSSSAPSRSHGGASTTQLSPTAHPQDQQRHHQMSPRTPTANARPVVGPAGAEGERPSLPIHYIQEKLQRLQSAPPLSDSERILRLVAQRQLLLQIELKDQQRAIHDLPDAYSEDRLGIPRASAGLPRHQQDVGHAADLWAQNARQHMAPQLESRHSFRGSASRGRSSTAEADGAASPQGDPQQHRAAGTEIEGRSFLLGDDGAAYCVPQRRVRIGELGRHVDAPEDLTTLISLSAYWEQHGPDVTRSPRQNDVEAATFAAAGGAASEGRPPIRGMTSPAASAGGGPAPAQPPSRRRRANQLHRNADPLSAAMLSPQVKEGGVVTYHAGHPWKRQSFWGLSPPDSASPAPRGVLGPQEGCNNEGWHAELDDGGALDDNTFDDPRGGWTNDEDHRHHRNAEEAALRPIGFASPIGSMGHATVAAAGVGTRSLHPRDRTTTAGGGDVEALLVTTVRELAPLKAATEDLLVNTIKEGHRVEALLSTSAARREQNRALLVQAKRAEEQLHHLEARMAAFADKQRHH